MGVAGAGGLGCSHRRLRRCRRLPSPHDVENRHNIVKCMQKRDRMKVRGWKLQSKGWSACILRRTHLWCTFTSKSSYPSRWPEIILFRDTRSFFFWYYMLDICRFTLFSQYPYLGFLIIFIHLNESRIFIEVKNIFSAIFSTYSKQ